MESTILEIFIFILYLYIYFVLLLSFSKPMKKLLIKIEKGEEDRPKTIDNPTHIEYLYIN